MNICCTVNEKFLKSLKVLLLSLIETQIEKIDLYLINYYLTENEINEISTFSRFLDINFHLIPFPNSLFQKLKKEVSLNDKYSIEVFFRLFIPQLLPNTISRVLFLDADTVLVREISSFYHEPFEENYAIAVKDATSKGNDELIKKRKEKLEMKESSIYFNAGVLLLNLDKLRKDFNFSEDNLFKVIKERDLGYHDQDILNFLLKEKVYVLLDYKFNCPPYRMTADLSEIAIIHYIGGKPWDVESFKSVYYFQMAPWWGRAQLVDKFENIIKRLNRYENSNNINM